MGRVAALVAGEFGRDVATRLEPTQTACFPADEKGLQSALLSATSEDTVILASWRELPSISEALDARAFKQGVSWAPVVLESTVLRIGPLQVPGHTACYQCYWRRRLELDKQAEVTRAVLERYAEDGSVGPRGHMPYHALAAAGILGLLLEMSSDCYGRYATVGLFDLQIAWGHVIGLHGCPRCGQYHEAETGRTSGRLISALRDIGDRGSRE